MHAARLNASGPGLLCLALGLLSVAAGCQSTTELDRGNALVSEGKRAEAIEVWQAALGKTAKDVEFLIRIATAQFGLRRLNEAEATLLRAAALAPDSPKVRHNLGLVYLWQKRFDKALETFHEVLSLEPGYPETHYYIGCIHEMRGDEATAVKHYVADVNNGPSAAWERLERYKEKQRALGLAPQRPETGKVLTFSIICLMVAAAAYALRLVLDIRQEKRPGPPGS